MAVAPIVSPSYLYLGAQVLLLSILVGSIVSKFFSVSSRRVVSVLLLTSVISVWLGVRFLDRFLGYRLDTTIENALFWTHVLGGIAVLGSLLITFLGFLVTFRKTTLALKLALFSQLIISGYFFIGFWMFDSSVTFLTRVKVTSPENWELPPGYSLYYLNQKGDAVVEWSRAGEKVISKGVLHHWNDRLFARKNDGNTFDMWVWLDKEIPRGETEQLIRENFAPLSTIDSRVAAGIERSVRGSFHTFGAVPKLGSIDSDWEFYAGYWGDEGLTCRNRATGESFSFSTDIPFALFQVRDAVQLPGDILLFQLGVDQICLFDPLRREICLLVRGRGPILGYDSSLR